MHIKRLTRLAGILEDHADNGVRFDLTQWLDVDAIECGGRKEWCGTKACAVGLALLDKSFRRQGLSVDSGYFHAQPEFDGATGFTAVQVFFGITRDDVDMLFMPESYAGKIEGNTAARKVARRIRQYVADPTKTRGRHMAW
jgi:hypothetical protein